jgi:hypothetical protein
MWLESEMAERQERSSHLKLTWAGGDLVIGKGRVLAAAGLAELSLMVV